MDPADNAVDRLQEELARYACSLDARALPPATLHEAKVRVIDTLGALLGGFHDEPSRLARTAAEDFQSATGATQIGTGKRVTPDMAAFVNGTAARCGEINDVYHHPGSRNGHPSDVIMPLLSVAEHAGASGRDFLAAVIVAYEIYLRFCDAIQTPAFDAANFCCIATAAGAGRLLGLAPGAMGEALAMAVVPNNALNQSRAGQLTMWKSVAAGQAGKAGVFAALLARRGMQGANQPFSGKHGWCTHIARKPVVLGALGGEGADFKIHDTIIKPRMACLHTLAPILAAEKAALALRGQVERVARVSVEVYGAKERAVASTENAPGAGGHHWHPTSRETADHSIPYCVAATLLDGTVTPASFDEAHLADARLRSLLDKVELVQNPEYTREYEQLPVRYRARVVAELTDGSAVSGETGGEHGDLSAVKTDAQIEAKFSEFAAPLLGQQRAAGLLPHLWQLDEIKNMATLPSLLVIDGQ